MDEEHYFEKVGEYKLLAKHEVGQNFLIDIEAARRIVASAEIQPSDRVLEIGSGAGSLSYFIDKSEAESDLIDIDEALVLKLQEDFGGNPKTHPQMGNVMRWDLSPYTKIIGNLPYYITSAILERILLEASSAQLAVLMVQKEVLTRLSAKIGSEDYGPLPILLQFRADFARIFNVARSSFSPAPHVDSSVFLLRFHKDVSLSEAQELYAFVSQLFLHRRKTILNNLTTVTKDPVKAKDCLVKAGIAETRRPEELSLAEFLKLRSQIVITH
jgi:16S rRNA (adenine1518-N6/adenine1519-N6)-dimethyltransferase